MCYDAKSVVKGVRAVAGVWDSSAKSFKDLIDLTQHGVTSSTCDKLSLAGKTLVAIEYNQDTTKDAAFIGISWKWSTGEVTQTPSSFVTPATIKRLDIPANSQFMGF